MAWIVALPMIALIFTSLGISTGLMGTVAAFSETAVESLQGLGLVISGAMDSMAHLPASIKIGMFIIVLAVSVISGMASVYHRLYRQRKEGKTWTFVVLLLAVAILTLLFWGIAAAVPGSLMGGFY